MTLHFNLEKVLADLNMSKNYLSVETKVRPATILDLAKGETKRIDLGKLNDILNFINDKAAQMDIKKVYTIDDIITYQYEKDRP